MEYIYSNIKYLPSDTKCLRGYSRTPASYLLGFWFKRRRINRLSVLNVFVVLFSRPRQVSEGKPTG